MRSMRSACAAVLAALLAGAAAAGDEPGARAAADRFYRVYLGARGGGVPTGERLAAYRPVLSEGLFSLLERAAAAEAEYARRTHDQSPPLAEGDLFTSLFEGASRYRVEGCRAAASSATCRVALTHLGAGGGKPVEWTDTVALEKEGGGWRVSDVEYGGTWEFMHAGRLVGVLESVIDGSKGP